MKDWRLPTVIAFSVIVAAIVAMFGLSDDPSVRERLLGYFESALLVATGGIAGGLAGFGRAKGII